jgi:protein gp37
MQQTKIAWTDESWNPSHGCSKVSEGCKNCYAEDISLNNDHTTNPWTHQNASENVTEKPHKLDEPHDIDEPSRIFVNSMSDLFHEEISDVFIRKVFRTIRNTPHHIYQILTKRPQRAVEIDIEWPPNVWLGTSVENKSAVDRIATLSGCGADILFVSFEPLIEPVGRVDLSDIDWAIVGGENAKDHERRDMEHSWARNIRHQCKRDNVAFFFKQSSAEISETGTQLETINPETQTYLYQTIKEMPPMNEAVKKARDDYNNTQQVSLTDL